MINGAGHTIQGTGSGTGILMLRAQNVTIQNVTIKDFEVDINFWAVMNFPADSKYWGLGPASNNRIINNNLTAAGKTNLGFGCIDFRNANNTLISGNTIKSFSKVGIYCGWNLYNNIISNNEFVGCSISMTNASQATAIGNTVDGKPIIYLNGASNQIIDNAGQVLLFNCNNITIKNLHPLPDYGKSIQLVETKNSEITNCQVYISLMNSNNNSIHNNSQSTIELSGSSYNKIFSNAITKLVCVLSSMVHPTTTKSMRTTFQTAATLLMPPVSITQGETLMA